MNALNKLALIGAFVLVVVLLAIAPIHSQTPVAVVEQYRIVPGVNQVGQPKTDAQIERELNALATEGWKVRAANQTAIILAH